MDNTKICASYLSKNKNLQVLKRISKLRSVHRENTKLENGLWLRLDGSQYLWVWATSELAGLSGSWQPTILRTLQDLPALARRLAHMSYLWEALWEYRRCWQALQEDARSIMDGRKCAKRSHVRCLSVDCAMEAYHKRFYTHYEILYRTYVE